MEKGGIEPVIISGLESVVFTRLDPQFPEQVKSLNGLETDLVYGPFELSIAQGLGLAKSNQIGIIGEDGSLEYTEESFAGRMFERVRQYHGSADLNNVSKLAVGIASETLITENINRLVEGNSSYWIGFLEDRDDEYVLHGLPAGEITYNVMHAFVVAWNHLSRMDHI